MSLRPVDGDPAELFDEIETWVERGREPLVVRTSGSSGEPKGVVLSRDAVLASARASLDRLGGPGQWLQAIPVTGVGGLQVLVRSVLAGVRPLFAGSYGSVAQAIGAMTGERRYASLVPTQVHRLVDSGEVRALADLDGLLIGGAAVPPELLDALHRAQVPVVRTYGMTETCGGCVYDGVPLAGVRLRLDDEGQVFIGGPVLFDGYTDPVATTQALRDGWFATADLGEFDDDGRLRVLGRSDDVVISGGVNVGLGAVSRALRLHEGVRDAVAVGVPDAEWGNRVVAYLVPDDAVCLDGLRLDEVRDGVEEAGLPRSWAPREVILLDALPLLPGGKVDRQALRRR